MNNINITKIVASISNTPEFLFNNGDSIIKLESNSYLVNSPTYCQNESGTDVYTYEELLFFIKKHSTIFEDKFDDSAYKKENYKKRPQVDLSIDNYFSGKEEQNKPLSKFDLFFEKLQNETIQRHQDLGLN